MSSKDDWKAEGSCINFDVNLFFDKYEDSEQLRPAIDNLCGACPLARKCFAVGVSQKEWGVWGGVYLENGKVSREFNRHKNKTVWAQTWKGLITD
tara:strand:- start:15563 stop:15847 length:285 start_codon:yes stop_codon:yes gene_type:complete